MEYSSKKINEMLTQNNFSFKKKYGQNFIFDSNLINSIITKANIDSSTLVIEIGPGAGSLTYFLSKVSKNVLCYEIDSSLADILKSNLDGCDNVHIIFDDFLKRDILEDIKQFEYKKLYVVANLPYYITTPIIMRLIDLKLDIDKMVVMVQKEVGNRFSANVGSREYNSLSIYLNYYFNVKKLLDVSRNVFIPKPNVDSIVVEFSKKENKFQLKNEDMFFKLVRDSFKQKRKTLKNNLIGYPLDKIDEVLKTYNMDLSVRAEDIPIDVFVEISNKISS